MNGFMDSGTPRLIAALKRFLRASCSTEFGLIDGGRLTTNALPRGSVAAFATIAS